MLTISELAKYAGVTVRAVRHYHAKGLLPEPEGDYSGYRRYDAGAVIELIRIRTLAEAGVPLTRVRELVHADDEQLAAAVAEIDDRLRAEIEERQRRRERIAQLAAGDHLTLPDPKLVELADELADYLTRLAAEHGERYLNDSDLDPPLADLMDRLALDTVPPARRLMALLKQRGWTELERTSTDRPDRA